ncbi:SRPBCC family protein [Pseudomonas sp. 15FMM2]|uniref:SRPBCC family protein n=1 Tax=Pseudomonas imrae TaxID=2992837 RepID=A0ACC7PPL1_9PSED
MNAVEHPAHLELISQQRYIQASMEAVYDYVTQPDRWHEWHPTSLSADTGTIGTLAAGHRFTETINLLGVRMPMSYRVQVATPHQEFKTVFTSQAVNGSIHYLLEPQGSGTLFKRVLSYGTELQLPTLHKRMIELSNQALDQLKQHLEAS